MSGIAGIFGTDGKPVDRALLDRLDRGIAHRGTDAAGSWIGGHVALIHHALWSTRESMGERQPLTDETADLHLTLDGRIDNRTELAASLAARGFPPRRDSDAELVLRAYQCWQTECPAKLLGDFAFALWDGSRQRLFCARDILGIRPFYYRFDGPDCVWASSLAALLDHPGLEVRPNEGVIGEYLANQVTNLEETLYRGILRLAPGHLLVVGSDGHRTRRYWRFTPDQATAQRSDEEHAARFREVFAEAVACRLRSPGAVGIALSGGLDSSAIVAMVGALRERSRPHQRIETLSLVYPGLLCDESAYIDEVAQHCGVTPLRSVPSTPSLFELRRRIRRHRDFPTPPNAAAGEVLVRTARQRGCAAVLYGSGGDEWLSGSFAVYADLLRAGSFREAWSRATLDGGGSALAAPGILYRQGLRPLADWWAPSALRPLTDRLRRRGQVPAWIGRGFSRRTELRSRLLREPPDEAWPSFAQRDIVSAASDGFSVLSLEQLDRLAAEHAVEPRFPFHDRRLVRFMLDLPEPQRSAGGVQKVLLRRALSELLPPAVAERTTKAEFSADFTSALRGLGGRDFFSSLSIASLGWIRPGVVLAMYRETESFDPSRDWRAPHVWPLWMIAGIELWVREALPGGV